MTDQRWFLHIGMHKTGTSTLQQGMWAARGLLADHGVAYGGFEPDHGLPLLALVWPLERLRTRERLVRRLGVVDRGSVEHLNASTRAELHRLRMAPATTVVVSGEGLSYLDGHEVAALRRELGVAVSDLRIVFYAREAGSWASSRAQQHVQSGATSVDDITRLVPTYRRRLEPWLELVGRGAVDVRIFAPAALRGGDLVTDFCDAVQLPSAVADDPDFRAGFAERRNQRLPHAAVESLQRLNADLPLTTDGRWNPARSPNLERHLADHAGPPFRLPAETVAAVRRAAAADTAWLADLLGHDPFPTVPDPTVVVPTPASPVDRATAAAEAGDGTEDTTFQDHVVRRLNDQLRVAERRRAGGLGAATGWSEAAPVPDVAGHGKPSEVGHHLPPGSVPAPGTEGEPSWRRRTLSVITPVLPSRAAHLPETASSVARATERAEALGWTVEWIVVVDGPGDLPDHDHVRRTLVLRLPRRTGPASGRNHALGLATGTWVLPLDADDTLVPPGLVDLLQDPVLEDVDWVAANRRLMDGSDGRHLFDDPREWTAPELEQAWRSPFPFHPNTVLVRRRAALAVGGWPGLDQEEDIAFVLALADRGPGASRPHDILRYRKWDQQSTAASHFRESKRQAQRFVGAVVNERRHRRGQEPIVPPLDRPRPAAHDPSGILDGDTDARAPAGRDVVILGSGRSGSSILGELFDHLPGYRYLFEPAMSELRRAPFGTTAIAAKRPRSPRTASKSPGLPVLLDDLLALPGPPQLVWLVRHPLDAICSLRPGVLSNWDHSPRPPNWRHLQERPLVERCAHHWRNINGTGFDQVADLASVVHFETLVTDPTGAARRLLDLLHVPDHPEVRVGVSAWAATVGNHKGPDHYEARIQTVWNVGGNTVRVGRFRHDMTDDQVEVCRRMLGDIPARFGYDLSCDGLVGRPSPPSP